VTYAHIAKGLVAKYGPSAIWKARGRQMRHLYLIPFLRGRVTEDDWTRGYRWIRVAEIITKLGEGKVYA
jgi:hypothetical protein